MIKDNSPNAPAGTHCRQLPLRAGIGLNPEHFASVLESEPDIGFFEIHAENYFVAGGPFHHYLSLIRERYPLSIHGVGLSLGGEAPPDIGHLRALRTLLERYKPQCFSEHLAWSGHSGTYVNDLLPLPYTATTLVRVCENIRRVQEFLGRQILIENPATYVEFAGSSYSEPDFIAEVVRRTRCGLLLDLNNVHVSCVNHNRAPRTYLEALPLDAVGEIHLAGFTRDRDAAGAPLLIDSHTGPVDGSVWQLYRELMARLGPKPTLIEWDNDVPGLDTLVTEAHRAELQLNSGLEISHGS